MWLATCALLDRVASLGVGRDVWAGSESRREAERIRAVVERALSWPEGVPLSSGTADDASDAGDAVAMMTTSLNTGEMSYLVASVLDQLFWRSFTRDWLVDRGRLFDLRAGDFYPVDEMRLMGAVGHSARPHRRGLRTGELPHVRRFDADGIRVAVNGEHPRIIDRLVSRVGNLLHICGHGVEDFVGGLVPHERSGVVVPVLDPGVDGVLELGDAAVGAAFGPFGGEF